MKNLIMRGFNSELNPKTAGQWLTILSRTIRSQIVCYLNQKYEDYSLPPDF
jgi:hypothetical protein